MPLYSRSSVKQFQCTAMTNDDVRCRNVVFDPIDGKVLCHIHHPKMKFQQRLREQHQDHLPEYAYDILYGDEK